MNPKEASRLAEELAEPTNKANSKNSLRREKGELFSPLRRLKDNLTINPLSKLPPNMACPCHSGRKFKKCCGPDTRPYIEKEALAEYEATYSEALAGGQAW